MQKVTIFAIGALKNDVLLVIRDWIEYATATASPIKKDASGT